MHERLTAWRPIGVFDGLAPVALALAARRSPAAPARVVALLLGSVTLTACNLQSASDDLGTLPGQQKAMLADDFDGNGTQDVLIGYGGDYLGITQATQDGYGFWSRHDLGTLVLGSELMASTDWRATALPT